MRLSTSGPQRGQSIGLTAFPLIVLVYNHIFHFNLKIVDICGPNMAIDRTVRFHRFVLCGLAPDGLMAHPVKPSGLFYEGIVEGYVEVQTVRGGGHQAQVHVGIPRGKGMGPVRVEVDPNVKGRQSGLVRPIVRDEVIEGTVLVDRAAGRKGNAVGRVRIREDVDHPAQAHRPPGPVVGGVAVDSPITAGIIKRQVRTHHGRTQ